MEDSDQYYWKMLLGNRFVIGEQLGRSGAATSAYRLLERGTDRVSVLLIPNVEILEDKEILKVYMDKQKRSEEIKAFCSEGYEGGILIPVAEFGPIYRIMRFAGVDFTHEIYTSLSEAEQKKLAFDFATYLNFVHQKSFEQKELLDLKYPNRKIGENSHTGSLEVELESYMKGKISDDDYQKLQQILFDFERRDISDEINVIIHGDLRNQNILYDATTKKLAIIDFEFANSDNFYKDLCPGTNSNLPPQFLADVIRFYNEQPKKYPIHIDEKKVALIQKALLLRELTYCGKARGIEPKKVLENFLSKEIIIDNYYGVDAQTSKNSDPFLVLRNILHKNLKRTLGVILKDANVSVNTQNQLQNLFDQQIQVRDWQDKSTEFYHLTDLPSEKEFASIKTRANNALESVKNAPIIKKYLSDFSFGLQYERDGSLYAWGDCVHIKQRTISPVFTLGVFNPRYYGKNATNEDVDTAFSCILGHELGHTILSLNMPCIEHVSVSHNQAFLESEYGNQISRCKEFICDVVSVLVALQTKKDFDVMWPIFEKTRNASNGDHTHWKDIFQMHTLLKRDLDPTQQSRMAYIIRLDEKQRE